MENKYLDILSKNVLNDVKNNIKYNNVYLKENNEIDRKMLEIIKSIILNNKENIFEKQNLEKNNKKEINSNIMPSLMQYYMALYNDNLDLLHKLLDDEFSFGNYKNGNMKLFVLDKNISSKFNLDEYIILLKNNIKLFDYFYRSLNKNNAEIDLNKIIEKFSNIIKKDNNIAISKETYNGRCDELLTVDVLMNFTEEEILNLNDNQKRILNGFVNEKDNSTKLKIDLIKNHNYSKELIFWNRFTDFFTKEEILNLSDQEIDLIQNLFSCSYEYDNTDSLEELAINKFKQIKKINPNFNVSLDCFVYSTLSIEQLMKISKSCEEQINILCSNFKLYNRGRHDVDFSEKTLKLWIKEAYYKDTIKRNIKKLIKIK